ncbi:MAG: PASTA domain-containing protein [Clostridiales bacterium]|jgi:stage V sporulation protein D (sporulation-specific penicillin-binding protein)|nr:PASTA domain-containing protein [Clostridiales bacterium]
MRTAISVKRRLLVFLVAIELAITVLLGRIFYIQAFEAEALQLKAYEQQTRDRLVTPKRGSILDRNGVGLAVTETSASVSVIRAQVREPERVARELSQILDLDYGETLKKVTRRVALERVQTKVDLETARKIRGLNLAGVIVDDDVSRTYPFDSLAAQVIGFVGRDNQGIIGLESKYDKYLRGEEGKILTETDGAGRLLPDSYITRQNPVPGLNLVTTLDSVVQSYAEQTLKKVVEAKGAKRGLIILMNPQNGEIYALANEPTFSLNDPFTINSEELAALWGTFSDDERMDYLNQMWRNFGINDTYEPGSTFKVITGSSGLDAGVIRTTDTFACSGGTTVGGRFIKCWYSPRSHGTLNFVQGMQNSCNPVFMATAARLGAEKFYEYLNAFGFNEKTGVDLPGEAVGIFHKLENVGPVELATMGFGQSFQITPLQLLRGISACVNGGSLITPHVGARLTDENGKTIETFTYPRGRQVVSAETSAIMRGILESVVQSGTGSRTYIPGYRIGGKTATSEKLPRKQGKYIASFCALAPAEEPQVLGIVLVDEPQGAYYGGQVTGPIMKELLTYVLPYIGVTPDYSEEELLLPGVPMVTVPDLIGLTKSEAAKALRDLKLEAEFSGEEFRGSRPNSEDEFRLDPRNYVVINQFPISGELVNQGSKVSVVLGAKNPADVDVADE